MSAWRRYQRARQEQSPDFREWRRREASDILTAALVIVGVFAAVLTLVMVTS